MSNKILLLLVEDDRFLSITLEASLQAAGFSVEVSRTGEPAMDCIDSNMEAFGGIITDINLGAPPDGWEVARHAREMVLRFP